MVLGSSHQARGLAAISRWLSGTTPPVASAAIVMHPSGMPEQRARETPQNYVVNRAAHRWSSCFSMFLFRTHAEA